MKKRILALLLTVVVLVAATGCTQTAPAAATTTPAPTDAQTQTVVNPMNEVESLSALLSAQPGIKLNDAPEGAANISYSWIANMPVISQISFTYQGCDYTYRAASCGSAASTLDISGVYEQFPSISTMDVSKVNAISGSYVLKYDGTSGAGLAAWYLPLTQCQYTLYTTNGCSGAMPLLGVMDLLYSCVDNVKTAKGTILSVDAKTITASIENGGTSVIELGQVLLSDIAVGDSVALSYYGDLNTSSVLVSVTKLGSTTTAELIGRVNSFGKDWVYVVSSDNNIFELIVNNETKISGVASSLSNGCSVRVTYTGNLYEECTAQNIEITEIVKATPTPAPTPTPAHTAAPSYVTRYTEGYVTSAAGVYVTVNGIMFTVNSADCYVSGYCYTGAYASISYRDYGGGYYVVTEAYFSDPAPVPEPYVSRTYSGIVTDFTAYSVAVDGIYFIISNSYVQTGYAEVGVYAEVYYNDYGDGYYELTYAYFDNIYMDDFSEFEDYVDYSDNVLG